MATVIALNSFCFTTFIEKHSTCHLYLVNTLTNTFARKNILLSTKNILLSTNVYYCQLSISVINPVNDYALLPCLFYKW